MISDEAKIALANYQWDHHGEQIEAIHWLPPAPKAHYSIDMEPEPDQEFVQEMKQVPESSRYHYER